MNKRFLILAVIPLILAVFIFTGCDKATPDPRYNYRVTGAFSDWGTNYDQQFMMENVAKSDPRLKAIKSALKDAQYVYLYEYTPRSSNAQGWNADLAGYSVDGRFCIKVIRFAPDSSDPSGWFYDAWIPSTEGGGVGDLSKSLGTMAVPMNRTDEQAAAAGDGLGSVNSNPILLKGDVSYYFVLAVMKDNSRSIGAVLK